MTISFNSNTEITKEITFPEGEAIHLRGLVHNEVKRKAFGIVSNLMNAIYGAVNIPSLLRVKTFSMSPHQYVGLLRRPVLFHAGNIQPPLNKQAQ